ncbi:glycoside hydrolase family 43 protein [Microbacterium sp.]|uniref:glycoside hydrolase family 43 protein n=1 Tax=Microbacterium sp. TaxID=51671 RepID=UPI0028126BC4|nr:glycoside hydrolase family 43 protein [Microbacterium sp.]
MTISKWRRMTISGFIAATLSAAALVACAPAAPSSPTPSPAAFLIDRDFADPDVVEADGRYVAFAINSRGGNVQFATSEDLIDWQGSLDDALPDLPAWASPGRTWAPDVSARAAGDYIMYFVATHTATDRQCIGVATSPAATGPFVSVSDEPLVCPIDEGGAIDPATFVDDDGTRYLIWKNDGNCCGIDTWIHVAPLSPDGTQLAGSATRLFTQTEPWEGKLVEGPTLVKRGGQYVMFYSANDYATEDYAVGVATAPAIAGPYVKRDEPLLSTDATSGRYIGPGGQDVITTPDGDVILFHGWDELLIYRGMHSLPLDWEGAVPSLRLPSTDH